MGTGRNLKAPAGRTNGSTAGKLDRDRRRADWKGRDGGMGLEGKKQGQRRHKPSPHVELVRASGGSSLLAHRTPDA